MEAVLTVCNISKVYGSGRTQVIAVRNVSLSIAAGEAVALMGPSGSGKSTVFIVLGLIIRPTKGSVLIQGAEVGEDERRRAQLRNKFFGYVHQDFAIIENETVERNVMIPLEYANARPSRQERRSRIRMVLDQVDLGWALKKNASQLSSFISILFLFHYLLFLLQMG